MRAEEVLTNTKLNNNMQILDIELCLIPIVL